MHPSSRSSARPASPSCLAPAPPAHVRAAAAAGDRRFHYRVHYLRGSALRVGDLARAALPQAVAAFLLTHRSPCPATDAEAELACAAVRRAAPHVPLYAVLPSHDAAEGVRGMGAAVALSLDELAAVCTPASDRNPPLTPSQAMLARGAVCPGAPALLANVLATHAQRGARRRPAERLREVHRAFFSKEEREDIDILPEEEEQGVGEGEIAPGRPAPPPAAAAGLDDGTAPPGAPPPVQASPAGSRHGLLKRALHSKRAAGDEGAGAPWEAQYDYGRAHNLYALPVPPAFSGVPFRDSAAAAFEQCQARLEPRPPPRRPHNPNGWAPQVLLLGVEEAGAPTADPAIEEARRPLPGSRVRARLRPSAAARGSSLSIDVEALAAGAGAGPAFLPYPAGRFCRAGDVLVVLAFSKLAAARVAALSFTPPGPGAEAELAAAAALLGEREQGRARAPPLALATALHPDTVRGERDKPPGAEEAWAEAAEECLPRPPRRLLDAGGHICVAGGAGPEQLARLVRRLREARPGRPIVLAGEEAPHALAAWGLLPPALLRALYALPGPPYAQHTLERAGGGPGASPEAVLLLADRSADCAAAFEGAADAPAALAAQRALAAYPSARVLVELETESSAQFLDAPRREARAPEAKASKPPSASAGRHPQKEDPRRHPRFAEGVVYTRSVAHSLLCQAYHQGPACVGLVLHALSEHPAGPGLRLLPNRPYRDLFRAYLGGSDLLPLGLYRAAGTAGAPRPFVYTNPHPETVVLPSDAVYLFSSGA
eukprot:tig00020614_g12170.t1